MRNLILLLVLGVIELASAEPAQVTLVVDTVLAGARSKDSDYRKIENLFPSTLTAADYEEIARRLILNKLDLKDVGDRGVTYKWSAIDHAMYELSDVSGGAASIIRLWEDKDILWDGMASLTLCDIAVRRGKEMLPLLANVNRRKDAAKRCMEHIVNGDKTAF